MINVCMSCGEYREDKEVVLEKSVAICPLCRYEHPYHFLPLLCVCGPSGSGKTTLSVALMHQMNDAVILDGDILFGAIDASIDSFNAWLRVGKNINQSKRPFVIFSAGFIPPNVEPCPERRYFSSSHYLALVGDDAILQKRLEARPAWRRSGTEPFIQEQLRFNHWLKDQAIQPDSLVELLDTTAISVETAVQEVKKWIRQKSTLSDAS